MTDPASLNVSVVISGMALDEACAVMRAMPSGAHWNGLAIKPAIGAMRYTAEVSEMSIAGATHLTAAHGICGGVPRRADRARAVLMVGEAFRRAEKACKHRFGDDPDWAAVESCRPCLAAALLDLSVFEPVLFPLEDS